MDIFSFLYCCIFLLVVVLRPAYGGWMVLATLPAYLLRFDIFGIPTTALEFSLYSWVLLTLGAIHARSEWTTAWRRVHKVVGIAWPGIVLFVIGATIGVVISEHVRISAGAWKALVVDPLLFFGLCIYWYRLPRDTQFLMTALSVLVWVVGGYGLFEYWGGFGMQIPGYLNSMYQSANMVALLLGPVLLLLGSLVSARLVARSATDMRERYRIIWYAGTIVVGVGVLYLTRSYGGLLGLLSGAAVMVWLLPREFGRYKQWLLLTGVVVVFGFGIAIVQQGKFQQLLAPTQYNSLQTRQQIWSVTIDLISMAPVTGVGFGDFQSQYYERAFEKYHPPLEWEVPRAHNLYLHTWVETGISGSFGALWLLVVVALRLRASLLQATSMTRKLFTIGLMGALVSVLVHGLLDTPYFKNDLSMLIWGMVAFVFLLYTQPITAEQVAQQPETAGVVN